MNTKQLEIITLFLKHKLVSNIYKLRKLSYIFLCLYIIFADNFFCLWDNCGTGFSLCSKLWRHVSYHSYHTKLMNIGKNVLQRVELPECTQEYDFVIPEYPSAYSCEWQDCGHSFTTIYKFFEHMRMHVNSNPKYCKQGEVIPCCWKGMMY